MPKAKLTDYSTLTTTALVILRMLIGWHLLYEGITKLINPYWSSAGYLMESKWIFSGWFQSIVANPTALKIVDFLNEWGLIAIGLGLIAGFLTEIAAIAGIVLLLLYYFANPPFVGLTYSMPTEGSYLIVNKTLIEAAALLVLAVLPTGRKIGLDVFLFRKRSSSLEVESD
jgi:thiosulfate dehydrogenase [quinone] large subunit